MNDCFDPAAHILRNLAIYRCIIFGILVYEWNHYLPGDPAGAVTNSWFTYDQFDLFYQLTPSSADPTAAFKCKLISAAGTVAGIIAAAGGIPPLISFELAGCLAVGLYLYRFLTFVHAFTNHNYLFALLAILTTLSGGGSLSTRVGVSNEATRCQIQRCEWIAITIRMQYAIVYFFASLWKLHADWWEGYIVKSIMLTFEEQNVARGVPWRRISQAFPNVFVFVAFGGLVLDTGMFLALTFRRPSKETSLVFILLSALFHCFVCFTMSQRIGYSFPLSCLAGSILFQPIGGELSKKDDDGALVEVNYVETNLVWWAKRYITGVGARATRGQRLFTIAWLILQLAIPLRMPLISKGSFPYTSEGYRFSWTMMLHARSTVLRHTGSAVARDGSAVDKILPIELLYLLPECKGAPLQRKHYMIETANPLQDPRTLPLTSMLNMRHFALINVFPRYIARVARGMSDLLFSAYPDGCQGDRVSVYGVHYAKLNDHGAFHRTFDPTVDLAASDARPWTQMLYDVLLDRAPGGRNEYLLRRGIGGSRARVEQLQSEIHLRMPNIKRVELIADRAECLVARPLALWLDGFPIAILPLEVPKGFFMYVKGRERTGESSVELQWDGLSAPKSMPLPLGKPQVIMATSVEIGITSSGNKRSQKTCSETVKEDVIFALLFMV